LNLSFEFRIDKNPKQLSDFRFFVWTACFSEDHSRLGPVLQNASIGEPLGMQDVLQADCRCPSCSVNNSVKALRVVKQLTDNKLAKFIS